MLTNARNLRTGEEIALGKVGGVCRGCHQLAVGVMLCFVSSCIAFGSGVHRQDNGKVLTLSAIAELGPGARKEISGVVQSKRDPTVYWTLNDSGNEPRIYPIRVDGMVIPSIRYPKVPGTRVEGAVNGDWEDIAIDSRGRVIIADVGNNFNARADLTLYFVQEPQPTEGRTSIASKVMFRYPDQGMRGMLGMRGKRKLNFDCEAIFTIGEDVYLLSKNRSDTFTKLYRLDEREAGIINTVTYIDRFDVLGRVTGADASEDGLTLAVLTYERIWLFERRSVDEAFFAGRVSSVRYKMKDGASDCEAICFENPSTLLVADEQRGKLYRVALTEFEEHRAARSLGQGPQVGAEKLRAMSFNIRYAGAEDGVNSWAMRRDWVADIISSANPDLIGLQEVEAVQMDWCRDVLGGYGVVGVGRQDAKRKGEAVPILYRSSRFTLLESGHFWLSDEPEVPGSRGWDGACERMATWVRLRDTRSQRLLLVLNTHLDHIGTRARREGLALVRERLNDLARGAEVVVLGDFNTSADGEVAAGFFNQNPSSAAGGGVALSDTFRVVYPYRDEDEVTFNGWEPRLEGERIDWIGVSCGFAVVDARIERWLKQGRPPSDHYPVVADLLILTRVDGGAEGTLPGAPATSSPGVQPARSADDAEHNLK